MELLSIDMSDCSRTHLTLMQPRRVDVDLVVQRSLNLESLDQGVTQREAIFYASAYRFSFFL